MTREEAVARIKDHIEIHRYNERTAAKIFEALNMAMKALEQPELRKDIVSRKDVLDGAVTHYSVSGANIAYRNAVPVEYIELLPPAQPEQRWIPCSERSPKKYGWYQVTLKDGRVNRLYYDYKSDRWIDNVRKHMFELYDIYSKSTHKRITEEKEDVYWDDWVIAWMPLPQPYEERQKDDEKNQN